VLDICYRKSLWWEVNLEDCWCKKTSIGDKEEVAFRHTWANVWLGLKKHKLKMCLFFFLKKNQFWDKIIWKVANNAIISCATWRPTKMNLKKIWKNTYTHVLWTTQISSKYVLICDLHKKEKGGDQKRWFLFFRTTRNLAYQKITQIFPYIKNHDILKHTSILFSFFKNILFQGATK
jgi:hypothetical protein